MDPYAVEEFIPFCFCVTPYLLAGLVIVAMVLASRRKQPSRAIPPATSPSEQELDHIDYAIAQLEEARDDNAVDSDSYAQLRRRLMARRQHVLEIRLAEVEQAAGPAAPATIPESARTGVSGAAEKPAPGGPPGMGDLPAAREPLTLARVTRWLLYLGVFLLFVATIIFAVYRWESFPEWVKFAILLAVTALFYAGGWYVRAKMKIAGGGLALIVVGAIMTFFDGYIYLSSGSLLDTPSAWAITLVLLAGVYLAVALLTPSRLLLSFSCLAQVAAIIFLGRHYYLNAKGSQLGVVTTFGTLLLLALLALVWLLAWTAAKERIATREEAATGHWAGRGRHLLTTLFASAHVLVATASAVYVTALLTLTVVAKLPAGLTGVSVGLVKMTGNVFALQIAFDVVAGAFFTLDWWRTKRADYLYAAPPVIAAGLLTVLDFAQAPIGNFPLAFALLALGLLLAGWLAKATRVAGFMERQLVVPAYVLAALIAAWAVPYLSLVALFGPWSASTGSDTRLLTTLSLGAFFLIGAFYQRSRLAVYPCAASFALFYVLALARLRLDADYMPAALVVLAIAWLARSWWMQSRNLVEFIHRPLAESSYAIACAVGVACLFEVIDAVESGSIRYAATVEGILALVLLTAFFALAAVYWRLGGHVYPMLLFATIACQLIYARTPMDLRYAGVFVALLGPVYLTGGAIARRQGLERLSGPFQVSAYAVSLYAITLSLASAPALITVLLVNAGLYVATAFAALAGQRNPPQRPDWSPAAGLDSFGADAVHLWLALLQLTVALFIALDYQKATHLQANVVYISFYLGIFAVSLLLRQSELGFGRRWAQHLVIFAALFCVWQLAAQTLLSLGGTEEILPYWMYAASTGADILMFAYVVAGFFYVAAAQIYGYEILTYGGFLFFLAAYVVKLLNLDVTLIEWYSVPIALYVLAMGYVHERDHPRQKVTSVSNPIGTLIMLGAPMLASMTTAQAPTAQLHAAAAAALSILFIAAGIVGRVRVFFFGGALFLAWDALYQSWEYLYALPKWATIGTVGLLMLVVAIYLERRREYVLDLARRARKTLTEEWK